MLLRIYKSTNLYAHTNSFLFCKGNVSKMYIKEKVKGMKGLKKERKKFSLILKSKQTENP